MAEEKRERLSGIELLKIISLMLIVISHVTRALSSFSESMAPGSSVFLPGMASRDVQTVVLNIFMQLGLLGNNIFFVCSAWFLIGRIDKSRKKAVGLVCTTWVISILFLLGFLAAGKLSAKEITMSVMPTCFGNNWYITCYIIFLFIYPVLNKLIAAVSQREHLRIVMFSLLIWVGANYVMVDWFFPSRIILWCTVYFLVAYMKLYGVKFVSRRRNGVILLSIGVVGTVAQVVVMNLIGLKLGALADRVLWWNTNCSPFYLLVAIGGLMIAAQSKISSRAINYISGLSLFIYLIHDNLLLRTHVLPEVWARIYQGFGGSCTVLWDLLFSLALFSASALVGALYKETLQKLITKASDNLGVGVDSILRRIEDKFI